MIDLANEFFNNNFRVYFIPIGLALARIVISGAGLYGILNLIYVICDEG